MLSVPDSELTEYYDSEDDLKEKVHEIACHIKHAREKGKELVFFTGAGISTAAKIADFRGPNGVWTNRDRGLPTPKSISFEDAVPTYTHRAIKHLLDVDIAHYVVSQNVDGLHLRSGVPEDKLSELHGNSFKENCVDCGKSYLRTHPCKKFRGKHFHGVRDDRSQSGISHITGRVCDMCHGKPGKTGMLRDSIIHFNEDLPGKALELAEKHCRRAGVVLCLGSSLHVTPAADLPEMCHNARNKGKMHIVNLQVTGREREARATGGVIVHGKTDHVMYLLMTELGIDIGPDPSLEDTSNPEQGNAPPNTKEVHAEEHPQEPQEAEESNSNSADSRGQPRSGFFTDLGIQPRMTQLPSSVHVLWEMKDDGVAFTVTCPQEYQLPICDPVDAIELRVDEGSLAPLKALCNPDQESVELFLPAKYMDLKLTLIIHVDKNTQLENPTLPILVSAEGVFVGETMTEGVCPLSVSLPRLRVRPAFKDRLMMAQSSLRKVTTTVRHIDGSSHQETRPDGDGD